MSEGEQKGRLRREITAAYEGRAVTPDQSDWLMYDAIDRLAADVAAVREAVCDRAADPHAAWREVIIDRDLWIKHCSDAIRERDDATRRLVEATRQLDEARRDLDGAMRGNTRLTNDVAALRDRLRASVAEAEKLRAELSARSAADVQPIGWIARHEHAPPVGKYVMCRWDVEERQGYARQVSYGAAKRGPDGMWRSPTGVEKIAPMHWMPLPPGVKGGDEWEQQTPAAPQPAAPPAGWLTDEERRVLQNHAESLREQRFALGRGGGLVDSVNGLLKREADLIDAMLARAGSPPVVALPTVFQRSLLGDELVALAQVKDAMDAAGVAWKEEPRE